MKILFLLETVFGICHAKHSTRLTMLPYWHTSSWITFFLLPALLVSSSSSCLHECLPELFFHVTVACFINSLPLLRCWWIITRPSTLRRLRGEERTRKNEAGRDLSRNQLASSWHFIKLRVVTSSEKLFLGQMVGPVRERHLIASMGRIRFIMCSLQSHFDWFSFFCRRHQASRVEHRLTAVIQRPEDEMFGTRQTKLNSDSIGSPHIQSSINRIDYCQRDNEAENVANKSFSTLISSSSSVPGLDLQASNVPFKYLIELANMYEHFSDKIANRFSMNRNENWLSNVFRDFRNSFRAVGFVSRNTIWQKDFHLSWKIFSLSSSFGAWVAARAKLGFREPSRERRKEPFCQKSKSRATQLIIKTN